jgi:hypothetical protein
MREEVLDALYVVGCRLYLLWFLSLHVVCGTLYSLSSITVCMWCPRFAGPICHLKVALPAHHISTPLTLTPLAGRET